LSIYKFTLKNYIVFVYFSLTVKIIPLWIINYLVVWLKQMSILNVCCFHFAGSLMASDGDSQSSTQDSRMPRMEKYLLMSIKFLTWEMSVLWDSLHTLQHCLTSLYRNCNRNSSFHLSQVTRRQINGFLKVYFHNYTVLVICL